MYNFLYDYRQFSASCLFEVCTLWVKDSYVNHTCWFEVWEFIFLSWALLIAWEGPCSFLLYLVASSIYFWTLVAWNWDNCGTWFISYLWLVKAGLSSTSFISVWQLTLVSSRPAQELQCDHIHISLYGPAFQLRVASVSNTMPIVLLLSSERVFITSIDF